MYDIVIKNGTVIDGTGKPGFLADVGISGGIIKEISASISSKRAKRVVNAKELYVTPGFIDIQNHSDSYWTLFDQPEQKSLLSQGITTIVMGNCGTSLAPLPSTESLKSFQKWHSLTGVNVNWASFREMLDVLEDMPKGVNIASLVGHATLRRGLLGDQPRHAKPEEITIMEKLLSTALDEGGIGLSMGLVYAHEIDSSTEELFKLTSHLKKDKKYLSVHLRSEAAGILDAVDEVIDLANRCQIPVKISHLKIRGQKNWHNFDYVINKLENAYHQGVDISFDVYPYSSSWSVLYTYLPRWAYEGGRDAIIKRLSNKLTRRKIADYLKEQQYDYQGIIVASAEANSTFAGKSLREIAANQNVSPEEALMNLIAATQAQVIAFDHNVNSEQVDLLISSPLSMIASDGAGYNQAGIDLAHPRCFGTMPAFLKKVREKRLMKWEQAVKKITSEPARLLGVPDRGLIKEGFQADIVVWDPKSITDKATYEHPYNFSLGVSNVLVNGEIAWMYDYKGSYGQVIKR